MTVGSRLRAVSTSSSCAAAVGPDRWRIPARRAVLVSCGRPSPARRLTGNHNTATLPRDAGSDSRPSARQDRRGAEVSGSAVIAHAVPNPQNCRGWWKAAVPVRFHRACRAHSWRYRWEARQRNRCRALSPKAK